MVFWAVEPLDYDIQYVPRGSIKLQALENFVMKFSSHVDKGHPP